MRENRTHGSEGGDGESRSRPLSGLLRRISLDTRFRGYDGTHAGHSFSFPNGYFQRSARTSRRIRIRSPPTSSPGSHWGCPCILFCDHWVLYGQLSCLPRLLLVTARPRCFYRGATGSKNAAKPSYSCELSQDSFCRDDKLPVR